ncbi:MAG: thioesterase, partial [Sulfurovum sp.]|nr:thioesterase [Sulfurovum sp.]
MAVNTHLEIDNSLCGKVTRSEEGYAEVLLHTTTQMKADAQGLVHGGFVFGAADYAAMTAVNDPYVVLGSSSSTFLAPVKVGDTVCCKATIVSEKGKK